jgi:hypothetical protein
MAFFTVLSARLLACLGKKFFRGGSGARSRARPVILVMLDRPLCGPLCCSVQLIANWRRLSQQHSKFIPI